MGILVYVNWNNEEIISEDKYNQLVKARFEEIASSRSEFADWLSERYAQIEIWEMSKADRESAKQKFYSQCKKWAEEDIEYLPFKI